MFVKGYFSKGILNLLQGTNIKDEVIYEINNINCVYDNILSAIEDKYTNFDENTAIDFDKYLSVDEKSITLDTEEDDDHYYLTFSVDCDFDIERFAKDNGLIEKIDLDERDI